MITNLLNRVLKLILALIMGVILFGGAMWALPALAGHGVKLSPLGVGAPDIEVNSDGSMVALTYYKRGASAAAGGGVYLKSADLVNGWRTRPGALGFSKQAPSLAFSTTNSTVYVVWIDVSGTSVKYARCTISAAAVPDCPEIGTVYEGTDLLDTPDIAIGSNHKIHIAWANIDDRTIQTMLIASPHILPINGTLAVRTPVANEQFLQPKLAASGAWVHLAYLSDPDTTDNGGILNPKEVRYVRSSDVSQHSWVTPKNFTVADLTAGHVQFGNPTIAANGAAIYLAWQALTNLSPPSPQYVLLGAQSLGTGGSWPNPNPRYITSNFDPSSLGPSNGPPRLSTNGGTPGEEDGLRPSVTVSPTGFALAWQERQDASCGGESSNNSSSEIYSAYTSTTWLGEGIITDDALDEYAIAPDITVAPDSTRHVAFMQYMSASENCGNGERQDYAIYYIGPFTITSNDQGEGGVFLPIVLKNS